MDDNAGDCPDTQKVVRSRNSPIGTTACVSHNDSPPTPWNSWAWCSGTFLNLGPACRAYSKDMIEWPHPVSIMILGPRQKRLRSGAGNAGNTSSGACNISHRFRSSLTVRTNSAVGTFAVGSQALHAPSRVATLTGACIASYMDTIDSPQTACAGITSSVDKTPTCSASDTPRMRACATDSNNLSAGSGACRGIPCFLRYSATRRRHS